MRMAKEHTSIPMKINMKDLGKTAQSTDKVCIPGPTVISIMALGNTMKNMVTKLFSTFQPYV